MPKFYEIKNQTETSSDLYIYGDIVTEKWSDKDETSTDLKSFRELVEGLTDGQTLNIYLNSGGGSVFAASAMVSMLKRAQARGVKVVSYIDGLAASAASLFPMVSDETHIYSNSMIMIHKPIMLVVAVMNANDLTKCADELESIENGTLIPIYKSRTKLSDQKLKNAIANETWYTADEIMENFEGFTLHEEEKAAAACTSVLFLLSNSDALQTYARRFGKHLLILSHRDACRNQYHSGSQKRRRQNPTALFHDFR